MDAAIIMIDSSSEWYEGSIALRDAILRKPLGMNIDQDAFLDAPTHKHFVAIENQSVVGVVVLIPYFEKDTGKLRQMATLPHARGKGYGIALVQALENYSSIQGMKKITLNSRHYATQFYKKIGYSICSEAFEEVGMKHYRMERLLG